MRPASPLTLTTLEERATPAAINFTLTPATSSLALSGTVNGAAISEQKAGSLTTTYTGTIGVDVDFSSSTVAFVGAGSAMKANNSGTWIPAVGGGSIFNAGSAPANYGGAVSISGLNTRVSARNLVGAFASTPLPLTGVSFPSAQTLTLTAGTVDYHNFGLQGTDSLANSAGANTAANGTFTDLGNGKYAIVLPSNATINDSFNGITLALTIVGTLNATAVLPVVDLNGATTGVDSSFAQTAGGSASAIAPAATITRSTAANLTSMTVTLAADPDAAAESLAVNLAGTGLATTGYNTLTGQLVITGTGTLAAYQTALRAVTYTNLAAAGTPGPRPVTVTVAAADNASLPRTANGIVSVPAAKIAGVQVNDGTDQRSRVTSLQVAFDRIVTLPAVPAAAFQLTRNTDSAAVTVGASVANSGSVTVVTLSFTGGAVEAASLQDGTYTLTVLAAQINTGNFDGDGNGTPGDNYALVGGVGNKLYRLFGDFNGDGTVEGGADFSAFGTTFGLSTGDPGFLAAFDFNADGTVEGGADFAEFGTRFGLSI